MIVTISDILEKNGRKLEESVYQKDSEAMRSYGISAGDFFEISRDKKEYKIYEGQFEEETCAVSAKPELMDAEERLKEISRRLKALKTEEEDLTHAHADEIKELRREKKRLRTLMEGTSASGEKDMIKFKNYLYATSFASLCRWIPDFSRVRFRNVEKIPYFTRKLANLKQAMTEGRRIGISGGPCLFGVNEVLVNIWLKDGSCMSFDFSSGRHFAVCEDDQDMAEDIEVYRDQIREITFVNQKGGVTAQEYDSMHCLFECARVLNAKLAIPLPDMSYIKFFTNIAEPLPEEVAEEAIERFRREAYKISDMYLDVIENLKKEYPQVEVAVVHERDQEMCRLFYEKRGAFLTDSVIRRLTAIRGKTDAVLDYITMPALPYYIWGITDVIQMDCLDETDSYRKCCKIHKGKVNLYGLMYPERISGDGENTIFYAPLEYKEYIV